MRFMKNWKKDMLILKQEEYKMQLKHLQSSGNRFEIREGNL